MEKGASGVQPPSCDLRGLSPLALYIFQSKNRRVQELKRKVKVKIEEFYCKKLF